VQELVDDILLQFNLQAPKCASLDKGFDGDCLLEVRCIFKPCPGRCFYDAILHACRHGCACIFPVTAPLRLICVCALCQLAVPTSTA